MVPLGCCLKCQICSPARLAAAACCSVVDVLHLPESVAVHASTHRPVLSVKECCRITSTPAACRRAACGDLRPRCAAQRRREQASSLPHQLSLSMCTTSCQSLPTARVRQRTVQLHGMRSELPMPVAGCDRQQRALADCASARSSAVLANVSSAITSYLSPVPVRVTATLAGQRRRLLQSSTYNVDVQVSTTAAHHWAMPGDAGN